MRKGTSVFIVTFGIALVIVVIVGAAVYFKSSQNHSANTNPEENKSQPPVSTELKEPTTKLQAVIYLNDQAVTGQANELASELRKIEGVQNVNVITKEEALSIYRERNKDYPLLTEKVTADFFPISIAVEVSQINSFDQIIKTSKKMSYVKEVITPPTPLPSNK